GLERGTQQVPQAGPRPRRACLRPHEDLEDPPRLPPQRRRSPPRHARNRPDAQPHPRRIGQRAARRSTMPDATRRSFTGQPLVSLHTDGRSRYVSLNLRVVRTRVARLPPLWAGGDGDGPLFTYVGSESGQVELSPLYSCD